VSPWWDQLMARVDALAALPPDWDGCKAVAPTAEAAEETRRILAVIAVVVEVQPKRPPQLVALSEGGMQIVWEEQGWSVEVGIGPTARVDVWAAQPDTSREIFYPPDPPRR
jgi:hypothetical protein